MSVQVHDASGTDASVDIWAGLTGGQPLAVALFRVCVHIRMHHVGGFVPEKTIAGVDNLWDSGSKSAG